MNIQDNKAVERLLNKQHEICSNILKELKQYGQKKTHWSWYIFPTDKPGKSDPLQTYITKYTVEIFLKLTPPEWRICLEQIVTLAIEKKYRLEKVLFDIDIGRVAFFIKFWNQIPNKPIWLSDICDILHILINKN
jgi:hypoxanthine phosphoribosyltransferase